MPIEDKEQLSQNDKLLKVNFNVKKIALFIKKTAK